MTIKCSHTDRHIDIDPERRPFDPFTGSLFVRCLNEGTVLCCWNNGAVGGYRHYCPAHSRAEGAYGYHHYPAPL